MFGGLGDICGCAGYGTEDAVAQRRDSAVCASIRRHGRANFIADNQRAFTTLEVVFDRRGLDHDVFTDQAVKVCERSAYRPCQALIIASRCSLVARAST